MHSTRRAAAQHKQFLLGLENVVGVGVGYKEKRSSATTEQSVVVCVKRKIKEVELPKGQQIPKRLGRIATDVVEVGEINAYQQAVNRRQRLRPAQPGVSIGHGEITCGTFGALVRDNSTRQSLILSNNHILANLTNSEDGRANIGDVILQPGPGDGGINPHDQIATLYRYQPVFYENSITNQVDAAVALPNDRQMVDGKLLGLTTRPRGTIAPEVGMRVYKSGAATGVTTGRVRIVDLTVRISYGYGKTAIFENQILTSKMAGPGDSGALLVDGSKHAIGLLVGGSFNAVIYSPIEAVLALLDVSID